MSQIIVGVRVRPFNQREIKYHSCNIVHMDTQNNVISLTLVKQGKVLKEEKPREFHFDHALWTHDTTTVDPIATQEYTYDKMGRPVLKNVLGGYNACLFAYGQTGSGKTYSMMGYGPEAGVTPRLCEELFQHIHDTHAAGSVQSTDADGKTTSVSTLVTVEASYLEIYNEIVKDLLGDANDKAHNTGLKVRTHPKTGVFVEGLKKHSVGSKDAIVKLLDDGQVLRSVAATAMNATSSRSHAILMVTVTHTTTTITNDGGKETTVTAVKNGKLSLVDLAGSERATSTGAEGDTLKEGSNINKSLTFLGMCLSRLAEIAESGKSGGHIPFRDSSLTFLLSDNLGGNSKTSMLANISPAEINFDETLSTLRFAQVTKKVKNHAVVNENPTTKMIRELKDELEQLRAQLKAHQEKSGYVPRPAVTGADGGGGGGNGGEAEAGDGSAVPMTSRTQEGDALIRQLKESEAAAQALEEETTAKGSTGGDARAEGVRDALNETKKNVFVDWRRPQLVNLCPESSTLVLPIEDGPNDWRVDSSNPTTDFTAATATDVGMINVVERAGFSNASMGTPSAPPSKVKKIVFGVEFVPLLNAATFNFAVTVKAPSAAAAHRALTGDEVPLPTINGQSLDAVVVDVSPPAATSTETAAAVAGEGGDEAPAEEGRTSGGSVETTCTMTYSQVVTHSDRIVIGQIALRVSHSTSLPSMPEFSKVAADATQLETLEAFERESQISLPCATEYQNLFTAFVEDAPAPTEAEVAAGNNTAGIVESAALIAQSLDDDVQEKSSNMRRAEEELINNYPITLAEQTEFLDDWRAAKTGAASGQTEETEDYSIVVEEANKGLDSKQEMIEKLKKELAGAGHMRRKREASMARYTQEQEEARKQRQADALLKAKEAQELRAKQQEEDEKEAALKESEKPEEEPEVDDDEERDRKVEEECEEDLNAILEKEMAWHSAVRKLRMPAPTGPRDPVDLKRWKQLGSANKCEMPFLHQTMQDIVNAAKKGGDHSVMAATKGKSGNEELPVSRCGMVWKQKQSGKAFEERFFAVSGRFLYYFTKLDGRERCRGAIYLYGATIARLNPSIERELGRKHCMLLTSPCPRSVSGNDGNSFYLSFGSENDLNQWEMWVQEASSPSMPESMKSRLEEEKAEQIANGTRAPPQAVSGSVKVGNAGRFNWKNEGAVNKCEHCATGFGFFTGKHHCETCGGVFCVRCCPVTAGGKRSCGMCREYGAKRPDGEGDDFEVVDDE